MTCFCAQINITYVCVQRFREREIGRERENERE